MTSADVHGKFLWHELVTSDPAAATAFYAKVLGWKSQPWEQDPAYTLLMSARGPAGGAMQLPADAPAGTPPQWVAYVGTPDIDATVASVQRLGGRVLKGVTAMSSGGRYAVLADPQGGTFGVFAPAAAGGDGATADEFAWHELATADYEAAFRFYHELFGWQQLRVHDMGPAGKYLLFGLDGRELGGMFNRPPNMAASWPHWLLYARVASATKAADAAKSAGGQVVNGPMEVPGGSWIAQLVDPQGAAIAVNQPQRAAAAKPAKAPKAPPAASSETAKPARPAAPPQPRAAPAAKSPEPAKPAARAPGKAAAKKVAAKKTAAAARPAGGSKAKGRKSARRPAAVKRSKAAGKRAAAGRRGAARRGKKVAAKRAPRRVTRRKSPARRKR